MAFETPEQHTDKNIIKFKNAVIQKFHRCGIEMQDTQLEIAILEILCDFGSRIDNPEPLQFSIVASLTALREKVCEYIDALKKSWDIVDQEEKELEGGSMQEKCFQECETQREDYFIDFYKGMEKDFPIYGEKTLDYDEKHKLFILVTLKDPEWEYKNILRYVLLEIFSEVKNYNEFTQDSAYDHFFVKFANQTMLFANYVDWYLRENALPDAELLIELSAAKYEGSESEARIYFDKSGIEEVSKFNTIGQKSRIINSENKRVIRKLMEISKRGQIFLYAEWDELNNNNVITTLVKVNQEQNQGLYIKFSGFMSWSIICGAREEIVYHHGKYWLNSSKEDKLYHDDIEHVKKELAKKASQNPQLRQQLNVWAHTNWLEELIKILEKQKHGTAVIVTDCEDEAERLCGVNRGTLLNVDKDVCMDRNGWNEGHLLSMTGIDGALFMNLKGQCLAMGVLMDGIATEPGDVGRGARYNSTVNYITQKKEGIYFGIIVSEDGMINLMCN